ncbi:MAG TPA: ADP-ribosylglycohydrolase family protein, partial [Acidimicrobiia bacterium]|nr:ADP-ribosylglycohydrolase family protein [Acidimicrobiia bacterium]
TLDRAAGTLVGLAAGDALGAGYEFGPAPRGAVRMIGGGLGPWEPGEWTDDTQLSLCVAEIAATGALDPLAVGDRLLAWLHGHPKDVGIQTRSVLAASRSPEELTQRAHQHFEARPGSSAGNGSLMRTAPVALAHLGNERAIASAARAVSELTHADPLAGDACVLWCIAIDRAVREARLDGVRDGLALLDADARARWTDWLDEAERLPPGVFAPNGYVVRALQAAWASIVQTPVPTVEPCRHLRDALEAAVRIGDDTDTVAAIAGALLGAQWGSSAVPLEWRAMLHGWPGYDCRDLVRLGILSATGGEADTAGWPSAADLVPSYRELYPGPAVSSVLADDPGISVGNVAAVELHTADVVVSLCRMGAVPVARDHHDVWLVDRDRPRDNPNLAFVLRDTADALIDWRTAGHEIFVHCVEGRSRTPTVAAAYLIRRFGYSADEALREARRALPRAQPNPGFVAALQALTQR